MGVTDGVHAKEDWHISIICPLLKTERSKYRALVPDTANGGMCRMAGRHNDIFDFGRKERILPG